MPACPSRPAQVICYALDRRPVVDPVPRLILMVDVEGSTQRTNHPRHPKL